MDSDTRAHIRVCNVCQYARRNRAINAGLLQSVQVYYEFWDRIAIDYVTVQMKVTAKHGFKGYIVVIDHATSYVWAFPVKDHTARTTAECLLTLMRVHGIPKSILSDRGKEFVNATWDFVASALGGLNRVLTTPYHPQSNGKLEANHKFILERLRSYGLEEDPLNWPTMLPVATSTYNNSPTSTSEITPYMCLFGRNPLSLLEVVVTDVEGLPKFKAADERIAFETKLMAKFLAERRGEALRDAHEKMLKRDNQHYQVVYDPGSKVLRIDERTQTAGLDGGTPVKLRRTVQDTVYRVVASRSNGNVVIQNLRIPEGSPVECHPSKLQRYVQQCDGYMAKVLYDSEAMYEEGDHCLIELRPEGAGKKSHAPMVAKITAVRADMLTYHIFQEAPTKAKSKPVSEQRHQPVWWNEVREQYSHGEKPEEGQIAYEFTDGLDCIVSDPFDLVDGVIPEEALRQASERMEFRNQVAWNRIFKVAQSKPERMKKNKG